MRNSFSPVVLRPLRVWSGRACLVSRVGPVMAPQVGSRKSAVAITIPKEFLFWLFLLLFFQRQTVREGHPTQGIKKNSFFIFLFRFAFSFFSSFPFIFLCYFSLFFFSHHCCLRPPYCCGLTASRGRFAGGKRRRTSAAGMQPDQTATRWESKGILPGCCR